MVVHRFLDGARGSPDYGVAPLEAFRMVRDAAYPQVLLKPEKDSPMFVLKHGLLYASDKGSGSSSGDGGTAGGSPAPAGPKKESVDRTDAMRADIVGLVKVNPLEFSTVEAAGKAVKEAVALLEKAGFVVRSEAKFTREPVTTFPAAKK